MPTKRRRKTMRCEIVTGAALANLANRVAARRQSLANAKGREDLAEQIVARELAGQLAERGLCTPQMLGSDLERTGKVRARAGELGARALERVEMSPSGAKRS